jgi:hypothetical protein
MAVQGVSGMAVGATAVGGILIYSGIRGAKVSDTLRSLVSGKPPPGQDPSLAISPDFTASSGAAGSASGTYAPGYQPVATGQGGDPASNQALGKMLAGSYGWNAEPYWSALVTLWQGESGWSNTADTRVSGLDPPNASVFAYGIPQARPYSKMPKVAWPPDKGGQSDAATQITWGLIYIKQSYGDPVKALAFKMGPGGGQGY